MGVVKEEGHEEKFGFPYRDVLDTTPVSPQARFNYTAVNNQTKMAVIGDMAVSVVFDFRDWHYMTNVIRFDKVVTDPDVIAGLREDTLTVDLGQVTRADKVGNKTKFEVAGRLYWEAHVYGDGITPFTTNGFFDREGYEQPPFISKRDEVILLMWVIGILLLLLLAVATLCKCHTARLKKEAGIREMYRDHRVSPNKKKEGSPSKRTENNNRAQPS